MIDPGFLVYTAIALSISLGLIIKVAPKYGQTNVLVYIVICSLLGSFSVACVKGKLLWIIFPLKYFGLFRRRIGDKTVLLNRCWKSIQGSAHLFSYCLSCHVRNTVMSCSNGSTDRYFEKTRTEITEKSDDANKLSKQKFGHLQYFNRDSNILCYFYHFR